MTNFQAENEFYLSCGPERIGKLVAQYELFQRVLDVPGEIVECGVFKGASFARWAMFRELFCLPQAKRLIGFDTFAQYFPADTERDVELRANVVRGAGEQGISRTDLFCALIDKGCGRNVELVAGDIRETVPRYVREHPELRISLLNVDVDFAAATETIMEHLYPRLSRGGILILDDYATFEGETRVVDSLGIGPVKKFPFAYSPCYVEKA
jgi:hypothetical protein